VDQQIVAIGNKSPTLQIRRWYDGKIMATQRLMDMGKRILLRHN
jgi:salicylate hydroxylase